MSDMSGSVVARVRAAVAEREARVPLAEVKRRALARPALGDGLDALRGERIAVIAELDPALADSGQLAEDWAGCGVGAIALTPAPAHTSQPWRRLDAIRSHARVPVLCTDVIASSYQLWEARAHGADLVLLSAAELERDALVSLVERAASIGLTAVVEVRDGSDLLPALRAQAPAVLLRAPHGDGAQAARAAVCELLPMIPGGVARVAECGSAQRCDLFAYAKQGADAIMLGRTVLAGADSRATVTGLASIGAHPALARRREQTV